MGKTRIILCTTLIVLAPPGAARAGSPSGYLPGGSGAYQYVESIPTATGQRPSATIDPSPAASGAALSSSGLLSGSVQRTLDLSGRSGQAAAALALATAPAGVQRVASSNRSLTSAGSVTSGGSPTLDGSPGTGRGHSRSSAAGPSGGTASGPSGGGGQAGGTAVAAAVTGVGGGDSSPLLVLILVGIVAGGVAIRLSHRGPPD